MSDERARYEVLNYPAKPVTLEADSVMVSRQDLETEHRQLLSRLHLLRRLLGYPPLLTGKQQRLQQAE